MEVLFTSHPGSFVSDAIQNLTGESVSHTAIRHYNNVYHSSYKGVNKESYNKFCGENKIYYALAPTTDEYNDAVVSRLIANFSKEKGSFYDLPALAYMTLRYILKDSLGIEIPKKNLWQLSGMYMCTEFVTGIVDREVDSTITPYKLYLKMKLSGLWGDIDMPPPGLSYRLKRSRAV